MKKLAVAVMLGISVMASGCGSQQATPQQVCTYNNVDLKAMGSYSASNPVIGNGMTFSFNNAVQFNSKKVDVVDGKQIVYGMITKDNNLCLYEIDVNGKQGWDKLENTKNVYQADSVDREQVSAFDLYNMGLPVGTDLNKVVNVTYVKGHVVHTHTKECK